MSKKIDGWVNKLKSKDMPVLGTVIAELNKITEDDDSSAAQLSEVILRDPNLTSHVLRVANSVRYNYGENQINTISRAIVLIGLKGVRAICISLLVLDRMLNDQSREHVLKLVAQGFHAAVQAQQALSAKSVGAGLEEEVFIAALLNNLGEMAYWLNEDLNFENQNLLSDNPVLRRQTEQALLGGTFKELTKSLGKSWKLGETLDESLNNEPRSDAAKAVVIGERISRASLYGWESPQFKKVLAEFSDFTSIGIEQSLKDVKAAADKASEVAVSYGAAHVCPLIPSSVKSGYFSERSPSSKVLQPDTRLQLSVLRELSTSTDLHVNTLFQTLMEGLHRGVGLERVAIAFIKGSKASVKYAVGDGTEQWRNKFHFDASPYSDNIFTYAMEQGDCCWLNAEFVHANKNLYTEEFRHFIGATPSLIFTIRIGSKARAIVYADRAFFGGVIDEEQHEAFRHFCTQARLCLNTISSSSTNGRA